MPGPAQGGGPRTVQLRRIGLAGYLDRNTIVRADAGYRLHIDENERWGEPPADMIGRVLAQDLTQRLPGSTVFTEAGAITADADTVVELDVQRFDLDVSGVVILAAQVAVQGSRGREALSARAFRLTERPGLGLDHRSRRGDEHGAGPSRRCGRRHAARRAAAAAAEAGQPGAASALRTSPAR